MPAWLEALGSSPILNLTNLLLAAALCGAILGFDRELKRKSAGLKTTTLVCVASALFTVGSLLIPEAGMEGFIRDPGRIAAQIVLGAGLLCSGVVIHSRAVDHQVEGLTTAANLWVSAALGICVGIGFGQFALLLALGIALLMHALRLLENRLIRHLHSFDCQLETEDPRLNLPELIRALSSQHRLTLRHLSVEPVGNRLLAHAFLRGKRENKSKFLRDLGRSSSIRIKIVG